ncbi:Hsp20/alpha crystallin family protein [Pediococcus cellicola]|uniref:Molecular chaperone (Small heat shock protein) n=1 Tax=Pediococcus cellicola TaxID=319652 RepID=A0A0R2IZN4_9LACO|nr:Hsp20/alpha crystallin family protein [Pediococcus cellicola]KRN67332.1 molecular chaperone (small heat shock protein) [Pediococcus cellicola]GEL16153.1 18 kDa heat shock protein [Pediococcus cellicola]
MANELRNRDFDDFEPFDFFDNFGKNFFKSMTQSSSMKTDIRENDKNYEVSAELPGFKKENIRLNYDNDTLTVEGKHNVDRAQKDEKGNLIRQERSYSNVSRQFYLPNVDRDKISASYDGGVLKITLPKSEEKLENNTQIPIN